MAQERSIHTHVDSRLVSANIQFGFNLFLQLLQQQPPDQVNLLISPTSVAIALTMTYNGAEGETQQAMARALQLQGLSLETVNQANLALQIALQNADPEVQLSIANSLWANQSVSFKQDFLQRNQDFFKAEIAQLNFSSADALLRINQWVNQQTQGKIPSILDQISPDAILFLINAVYFKGKWTTAFDATATAARPFYQLNGTTKQHPMMVQQGNYRYLETEHFQAVSLPYGNGELSLYIFLPTSASSLNSFYTLLTCANWQHWLSQFRTRPGTIQLPRFKFEYSTQLNDALQALGMSIAFSDRADFSGLTDTKAAISKVIHKTFIDVNEAGTEAAAATVVGMTRMAMPLRSPFEMRVDRPFFYVIREQQTGSLLFLGAIGEFD